MNGVVITKSELNEFLLQQVGQEALDTLIQKSIIKQEAQKLNIQVSEKEAKEAILEESKDKIKDALLAQKVDTEFDNWLRERFAEYAVENYLTKN